MSRAHQAVALVALLGAACGVDQTAPSSTDLHPRGVGPLLAPPVSLERARPLPLSTENVGWCDLVVHRSDGGPSRHSPLRAPASRGNAATGQPRPLGRIQFARWEKGTRRAVAEASCVVELDGRSARELRLAFARELDLALGQGFGNGQSSLRAFEGIEGSVWNGEDVDCMLVMLYTIVLEMDCGGVDCGPMATLRMAEEGPVADIFFECDNGCTVDMDHLVYDCGNVGGDVEEGSGGGSRPSEGGASAGPLLANDERGMRCEPLTDSLCNLRPAPDSLKHEVLAHIIRLPEWARNTLAAIVNDTSVPPRFQVWTNLILDEDPNFWIPADVHHDTLPGVDPDARFHLYVGPGWVNEFLLRTLCHEAAHIYYDVRDGTSALEAKITECLGGVEI